LQPMYITPLRNTHVAMSYGRLTIVNPSYFFPAKASIGEERKPLETTCESETIPQIFVMTYITQ
jgi:hypothetical protein